MFLPQQLKALGAGWSIRPWTVRRGPASSKRDPGRVPTQVPSERFQTERFQVDDTLR